jgi:hypothetical protein
MMVTGQGTEVDRSIAYNETIGSDTAREDIDRL